MQLVKPTYLLSYAHIPQTTAANVMQYDGQRRTVMTTEEQPTTFLGSPSGSILQSCNNRSCTQLRLVAATDDLVDSCCHLTIFTLQRGTMGVCACEYGNGARRQQQQSQQLCNMALCLWVTLQFWQSALGLPLISYFYSCNDREALSMGGLLHRMYLHNI